MTARIVRGEGRNWHVAFWRVVLAALALAVAWLILASASAAQERKPGPAFPFVPIPGAKPFRGPLPDFDPDRFFEQFFGPAGGELDNDALLAKVEVNRDEEAKLGQQVLDDLKQGLAARKLALVERGKDVQYLERLVAIIQPQMQHTRRYPKLRVYSANLSSPEAYALPGGRLFVSEGMLDQAGSEAALLCVLGHELAHLDRGHLLRRAKQWKLAQERLAKPPTEFSLDKMFDKLSLMQRLFRRPFGPAEELDADRDGITWAYRAGYDPLALQKVFGALEQAGLAAPDFLPAFIRTHPLTAERRDNLRATYAQLQAAAPNEHLYLGRENLARRLPRSQREFAE
jgi:Peptidase family M48